MNSDIVVNQNIQMNITKLKNKMTQTSPQKQNIYTDKGNNDSEVRDLISELNYII